MLILPFSDHTATLQLSTHANILWPWLYYRNIITNEIKIVIKMQQIDFFKCCIWLLLLQTATTIFLQNYFEQSSNAQVTEPTPDEHFELIYHNFNLSQLSFSGKKWYCQVRSLQLLKIVIIIWRIYSPTLYAV